MWVVLRAQILSLLGFLQEIPSFLLQEQVVLSAFSKHIPDTVANSHLSASPWALRKVGTAASIAVRAFPTQPRPFCCQDLPCLSEQVFWAPPEPPNLLWRGLHLLSQAQVPSRISWHRCWVALETGECSLSVQRSTVGQGINYKLPQSGNSCPACQQSAAFQGACLSQGFPWGLGQCPVTAVSSLLSCFMLLPVFVLFSFVSFILVLQALAGVRAGFFPLLPSGILQAFWASCLLEKWGCPATPRAMQCQSSTGISSLF